MRLLLFLVGVGVLGTAATASADELAPETIVGRWSGSARWKDCTIDGARNVTLSIGWHGGYVLDAGAALDGLPSVSLGAAGNRLTGEKDDLTATVTVARGKATVVLTTGGGCTGTLTLRPAGSGIAACDEWTALATIRAGCDALPVAAGEQDKDVLAANLSGRRTSWAKLKGKARGKEQAACAAQVATLRPQLASAACLGGPLLSTGLPECDAYLLALDRYLQCPQVPVELRAQTRDSIEAVREGWAMLRDPSVPAEARAAARDGCQAARDALAQGMKALGCGP
jgi:hypothetical protein